MGDRIRIVLADVHPLFREGVARRLSDCSDYDVVAVCACSDELLKAVCDHSPDIAMLDISLPGGGVQLVHRIQTICPTVRMVILTASDKERDVTGALESGVRGYVLKGVGGEELSHIIRSVHRGNVYISPDLSARILMTNKEHKDPRVADLFSDLTDREAEILKRISLGLSNRETARALTLSEQTVKHYMSNVLQKLQVRNRVEAAIKAREYYIAN